MQRRLHLVLDRADLHVSARFARPGSAGWLLWPNLTTPAQARSRHPPRQPCPFLRSLNRVVSIPSPAVPACAAHILDGCACRRFLRRRATFGRHDVKHISCRCDTLVRFRPSVPFFAFAPQQITPRWQVRSSLQRLCERAPCLSSSCDRRAAAARRCSWLVACCVFR